MKKILALLLAALLLPLGAVAETIVTSFYPIYLFTLNLTEGIEGIEVRNLAAPDTGCLHDYQLQTGDMKKLAEADAFLINGAGMESYLSGVMEAFPQLPVVDASAGIELLCAEEEHDHDHDHDHDHGESNAHVWLDAENAQTMVRNLADGLMAACPASAEQIAANRDGYIARLAELDQELTAELAELPRKDIITFHEAFPYFAQAYGLNVAAVVNREPSDALSPAKLAELVKTVRDLGVPPLFVEPQYEDMAAQTLARETGAKLYTLDPVVTGPVTDVPLTYYEDVMRANVQVLLTALTAE
ncbi:MAG: zinc ABC transporter substrate-binding protein [Clostridia bacterium]|nr:zinc ABC transporter substrate-binding protein [Clostridia bacterium]